MNVSYYISALIIACILLIPLGKKWCIRMKVVLPSALVIGLLSGFLTHIALAFLPGQQLIWIIIFQIVVVLALAAFGIVLRFYRDPERVPPVGEGIIVSPADGEVIYIKKIHPDEVLHSNKKGVELPIGKDTREKYFQKPIYVIGIMMNYLDVHVTRVPIGGRVEFIEYIKGKFLSLRKKESYFQNERTITVIDCGKFVIGVIQIASRLVRRISSYIKAGEQVQIGKRMGVITFGSQVDIIIPVAETQTVETETGDTVKAGLSIIARLKSP